MRIQDKQSGITHADMVEVGRLFGIRAPSRIIDKVRAAVADWPRLAENAGVQEETLLEIKRALLERHDQIAG